MSTYARAAMFDPNGVMPKMTTKGVPRSVAPERMKPKSLVTWLWLSVRVRKVILKLNDGFSGLGNAVVEVLDPPSPIAQGPPRFCAADESWPSYAAKIAERGVVVEEYLQAPGIAMPSVLFRITPGGTSRVVATHDQILGGPYDQVYLGCWPPTTWSRAA